MKTLYLDCAMGAAGDMLTAALLELVPDKAASVAKLNALGIPGVEYKAETVASHGIYGTHMHVFYNGQEEQSFSGALGEYEHGTYDLGEHHHHEHGDHDHEHDHEHGEHCHEHEHGEHCHDHGHHHSHHHGHGMHEIGHIVEALDLDSAIKTDVMAVFNLVAEAECSVHGAQVEQIHFHELGTMDAIADIVAVCSLMHQLAPERVVASAVHVGSGMVDCAHGTLPVPAPATEYLLKGIPSYGGAVIGELCTPTGAALLKYYVDEFGKRPTMSVERIGYGMGTKDFGPLNAVRALLGELAQAPAVTPSGDTNVIELSCNLDDMSAEDIAFAADVLREAGAHEVFTSPITMKKGRLGTLLVVLCEPELREQMVELIFKHTTTIGMRETLCARYVMRREMGEHTCTLGTARYKASEGYGSSRTKYEFDDLARIARERGLSLAEVRARFEAEN